MCVALLSSARAELAPSNLRANRTDRIAASLPELVQAAEHGASQAFTWATELKARWQHLERLRREPQGAVWLGGLREPRAFLSATKQRAARASGCRLEEMKLRFEIGAAEGVEGTAEDTRSSSAGDAGVDILGLTVQGIGLHDSKLVAVDGVVELTSVRLVWALPGEPASSASQARLKLPLYADGARRVQLAEAELIAPAALAPSRPPTGRGTHGGDEVAEDAGLHRGAAAFAKFP